MSKATRQSLKSASISARGIVQGVGFRPFVYGLAVEHNLKGWVYNTSEDVKIEVEGEAEAVEQFERELEAKAPPLAHIENITTEYHPPLGYENFEIRHSQAQEGKYQLISPDVATCQACLGELLNPMTAQKQPCAPSRCAPNARRNMIIPWTAASMLNQTPARNVAPGSSWLITRAI